MTSAENRDGKALSNDELTRVVVKHILDNLEEYLDKCGHIGVRFPCEREDGAPSDLPDNMAQLQVDKDSEGEVTVSVGVSRKGTDRLYSNYLFEAGSTLEEVRGWLGDVDVCVPIILDSVRGLSSTVDDYWG